MAMRDGRALRGVLTVLVALAIGCSPMGMRARCSVDADCASGVCEADGRCAPQQDAGLPSDLDGGEPLDGRIPSRDAGRDAGGRCLPNEDGVVRRNEAPFGPGLMARYMTTFDVPVDTAGTDLGGGRRRWSWGGAMPGDRALDLVTEPLDGRWFVDRFPGADYVTRLSGESDLLGVFRVTETALELMGVVSPTDGIGRTQLTYDPPVRVLVFPLEAGSRWTSNSAVTGLAQGLAVNYRETYESEVDARGEVVTPYAAFEALRVRTTLTRDIAFSRTTVRQFLFVAECFGTVATVVSEENEPEPELDRAAEIRRLGF
jgi:hypothetical protein